MDDGNGSGRPPPSGHSHEHEQVSPSSPPREVLADEVAAEDAAAPATPEDPVARLKDQLLRTAADFDNFRKRTRKDVEEAERRGREEVLREILPIADNLERAVAAADTAQDPAAVAEGVRMVLKQFEDSASRLGLERVPAVGEKFDPTLHDAVQQVETDEHPPGTIVAEVVPGYRLGDRLLRAALVVVARPKTGQA
jgi:molecular chaperone GrpE